MTLSMPIAPAMALLSTWILVPACSADGGGGGGGDDAPGLERSDAPPPFGSARAWIEDAFGGLPLYGGALYGVTDVIYPSLVEGATCAGGYYCLSVWGQDPYSGLPDPASEDQRIAFVDVSITDQIVDGLYGAGIIGQGDPDWNNRMDYFLANVTIEPHWPEWAGYDTTNLDGITFDAGWEEGHVYLEDVTIRDWNAEAALDVKPRALQAVRLHTEGHGYNTLKLWHPGPHYLVDSTIDNDWYRDTTAPQGDDGALIWTWDCATLEIRIWNTTFNGSPTIPPNGIACTDANGTPTVTYLDHDPRTTGEMHPMFVPPSP